MFLLGEKKNIFKKHKQRGLNGAENKYWHSEEIVNDFCCCDHTLKQKL